jgi:hypothetical protein
MKACLCLFVVALGAAPLRAADEPRAPEPSLEARVLEALVADRPQLLAAYKEELDRLPPGERRQSGLRIDERAVELHFHGRHPLLAKETAVEFLLSTEDRAYESLLVVTERDVARLASLAKVIAALTKEDAADSPLRAQLVWVEERQVRVESVRQLLGQSAEEHRRLWPAAEVELDGLRVPGTRLDRSIAPREATSATLIVTIVLPERFRAALK